MNNNQEPECACVGDEPLLSQTKIAELLKTVIDWEALSDKQLVRNFTFKDFSEAVQFVVRVSESANKLNHHPDILLHDFNKVTLTLSTHSSGGITEKDFMLAKSIDAILK